jgi:hypothetical protein
MQSKLSILCAWYHDGKMKERARLTQAYLDMTSKGKGRSGSRGSQAGYTENIATCAISMGKAAAALMAKLWSTTSIPITFFRLPWNRLADDIPRQVLFFFLFLIIILDSRPRADIHQHCLLTCTNRLIF